jgi:PAS domain S-box-containing protein
MIGIFRYPTLQPSSINKKATLLFKLIWGVLAVMTVTFVVAIFLQYKYLPRYLFILCILWLISSVMIELIHRSYVRLAAIMYIVLLMIMIFTLALNAGGIRGHGIRLLPILVLFSGLAIGRKQVWIVGLATILSTALLVILEYSEWITVREPLGNHPMIYWFYSTQTILLICFIEYLSVQRFNDAIAEAEEEANLRVIHELKYKKIFDSFQDIYYQTNQEGLVVMITPSVKKRLGYDQTEVVGKQVADFYHQPESRKELIAKLNEKGELIDYEINLVAKDGSVVHMTVSCKLLKSDTGEISGIEGTLHDITERKRAEDKLRAQNQQLKEIANLQSHMVRRPVANVIGLLRLIDQHDPNNQENKEILEKLVHSSDELDDAIRKIVERTKQESQ